MMFYRFPGGKGSNVSLLSMDYIISDTNYTCSTTSSSRCSLHTGGWERGVTCPM